MIYTGKTELLRQKPISFLICPQHVSNGLSWYGTWASVLSGFIGKITIFSYTVLQCAGYMFQHCYTIIRPQLSAHKRKKHINVCVCVHMHVCVCYIAGDVLMC